ncbi:pyridoxamine 5'-phosphate oxidase family protein [Jannaschia sp. R86511]|uniref:pyridoxamine 5'-phosphate oxidase family protein n=1 Tax=Jannaschia sp. R86511 TaxID=3093853 RepID=UPI0036D2882F
MSSWSEFAAEQPDLAREVRGRLDAHVHKVMATLRADGSPRLCGTEVVFAGDDLWLAGMVGARRFTDLRRDARVAVHSGSDDVPGWTGDARLSGTAHETTDPAALALVAGSGPEPPPGPFELFRIDLTEVVAIRLSEGGDAIVVESWRPGRGLTQAVRA